MNVKTKATEVREPKLAGHKKPEGSQIINDQLSSLLISIKKNTANTRDYEDYEKILLSNGINEDDIDEPLRNERIDSWDDLIAKRIRVSDENFEEKHRYEAKVVGTLLGLGQFVLFNALDEE